MELGRPRAAAHQAAFHPRKVGQLREQGDAARDADRHHRQRLVLEDRSVRAVQPELEQAGASVSVPQLDGLDQHIDVHLILDRVDDPLAA